MNKEREYLKYYIDTNANIDLINKFIKEEGITLNEYNDIVTNYLKELKKRNNKTVDKLYLEYTLKFGNKIVETKRIGRRKTIETVINIINNYIKEDKHNIKEYVNNSSFSYDEFKRIINNFKDYYLKDKELEILKKFFKRENEFNKNMLKPVTEVVDKISDDLVNDKPFTIINYYETLGWDSNLLLYYLNNNKETFSNFIIDNVNIYIKKYHINAKIFKLKEFIEYINEKNKDLHKEDIEKIIEYMNQKKFPYNYYLFNEIKNNKVSE